MPVYKSSRSLLLEPLEIRLALDGAAMPAFSLPDMNAASESFQQNISPSQFAGEVSAWYFAHATCGYCTTQFGYLDTLQQELASTYPLLKIQILGVNDVGSAAGNAQITAGRNLPWLQDTDTNGNRQSDVWTESWQVAFRDVVVLNGAGEKVAVYNLTDHNLATSSNYAELKQLLIDTALASQLPWHNSTAAHDVNRDGLVTPLDALLVIIDLNANQPRRLAAPIGNTPITDFVDTTGDGLASPLDALAVLIYLNDQAAQQAQIERAFNNADKDENWNVLSDTFFGDESIPSYLSHFD